MGPKTKQVSNIWGEDTYGISSLTEAPPSLVNRETSQETPQAEKRGQAGTAGVTPNAARRKHPPRIEETEWVRRKGCVGSLEPYPVPPRATRNPLVTWAREILEEWSNRTMPVLSGPINPTLIAGPFWEVLRVLFPVAERRSCHGNYRKARSVRLRREGRGMVKSTGCASWFVSWNEVANSSLSRSLCSLCPSPCGLLLSRVLCFSVLLPVGLRMSLKCTYTCSFMPGEMRKQSARD